MLVRKKADFSINQGKYVTYAYSKYFFLRKFVVRKVLVGEMGLDYTKKYVLFVK